MKKPLMILFVCMAIILSGLVSSGAGDITIDEHKLREIIKQVIKENPKLLFDTINEYIKEQKKKRQIQELESSFKNRIPYVVSDKNPFKGQASAPITIVEYTDFQCPHCNGAARTVDRLLEMYPGKIRLVFKNNPLEYHPQALPAAKAALAAHRQGKFWAYHDLLFKNSSSLNEDRYITFAKDLSLDMEKFNRDRNSDEIEKQIASEKAGAAKHNLKGTPTFLFNGVPVRGAKPVKCNRGRSCRTCFTLLSRYDILQVCQD